MTTLYPNQTTHAHEIYRALVNHRAALDTSETGTGKTIMSSHIAAHWKSLGRGVGVVCPKSVTTSWLRTLRSHGVEPLFVLNYESIRNGRPGIVSVKRQRKQTKSKKVHKWYEWEVPADTLLIFDEVQWCKGHYTQNGNLLIAATKQNYHRLLLSATAAKDPTEMRAVGFALGLHDLDHLRNNNSWFHWMKRNQCFQDPWRQWRVKKDADLTPLAAEIFDNRKVAHGLKTSDMPGAFKGRRTIVDLGDYKGASEAYEQAGLTEEVVDELLLDIATKKAKAKTKITDILRARQYVEMLKVTHFIEKTNELLAEGKSVVAFFNFRESIEVYRKAFPESGILIGQQDDRVRNLDAWANDEFRVMAVSSAAGGTGVNLHDQRGEFPRVALISPGFSVQIYKQVLGRCFRAGMKTDVTEILMVAAETIEEYVHQRCMDGVENMEKMLR